MNNMAAKPTDKLMELLNLGVAREMQVAIQYSVQHTKMEKIIQRTILENIVLDTTTYDAIGKILKEFAIQEMKHMGAIMERIYYLEGSATTEGKMPQIGETLSDFAKLGVAAEEEALALYRKTIEVAGACGDWETRELFEKIYGDEEKHYFKFQEYAELSESISELKAPEAEWMKAITPDFMALLGKALAGELQAIIQYTNQHEMANKLAHRKKSQPIETVTGKTKADVFSDLLRKVFLQEMEHFEKIAERVYRLEGEATLVPDPYPNVGETPEEWFLNDRLAEDQTITLYRDIINQAIAIGDHVTRTLFEKIIGDEDTHFFDFDDFFAK
jgi:bacterioferritin (cytochrome b1)